MVWLPTTKKLLWPTLPVVGNRKKVPKNVSNWLLCRNKKKTKEKNKKNFLSTEKMKQNPDLNKINKSQNHLQDIQNYKATGL